MAEITAAAVKSLRDKTDLPMMMCKEALKEANGDEAAAMTILAEKAGKKLSKRTENATEEGRIFTAVSDCLKKAVMVEIQCESAPVASGEHLAAFGASLTKQLLDGPGAATADELLDQPNPNGSGTLREAFESLSNRIQEKIVVARVTSAEGPVGIYVHHDGKVGALLEAEGEALDAPVLRDVAMHVAAMRPTVARVEDVDAAKVAEERARLTEEALASGKPQNIVDKIVDGRMSTFFRDEAGVLTEQAFAKDDSKSVKQVLAEAGLKVKSFTLWVLGA
ncbi:MAG: translation elongation factor Ts [Planctomycetaceae bacterium]|nr:translation elongation factor Ts [Planctomycetaceae bacterium]